jgi:hypothetical protein
MITSLAKSVAPLAKSALAASHVYCIRELHVEQVNNTLLISGSVSSFYYKQLAQETVRSVTEGVEVVNSIEVD